MDDLISRKALIEWLTSHFDLELDEPLEKEMIRLINDQDAIQPQGIDKDRLIEELEAIKFDDVAFSDMREGWNLGVKKAIRIVKKQPTTDGWIPVSERLPEDPQMDCYITINNGCTMFTYKGRHSSDARWRFLSGYPVDAEVTAWQPIVLPQPYKESEEE